MISVIVPIYKGKQYIPVLKKQIEDATRKIEEPVELILSNDDPQEYIDENIKSEHIIIRTINSEMNTGIHGARVRGLLESRGDLVLFLDQDDCINKDFFWSQLQCIEEADAVICTAKHGDKVVYSEKRPFESVNDMNYMLDLGNAIVSPGQVLIKKSAIPSVWMEKIMTNNGADDWFLWIVMLARKCTFKRNHSLLFYHNLNSNNASDDFEKMSKSEKEMLEILRRNNVLSESDVNRLESTIFNIYINRMKEYNYLREKKDILYAWIKMKQEGRSPMSEYCSKNVLVYGCGDLGQLIVDELVSLGNSSVAIVDKNKNSEYKDIKIHSSILDVSNCDVIILSLIKEAQRVCEYLKKETSATIVSITELLQVKGK